MDNTGKVLLTKNTVTNDKFLGRLENLCQMR